MMEALVGITKSAMRTRSLSSLLQRCGCRFLSSKSGSPGSDHVGGKFDLPYGGEEIMKSWQIHSYGGPSELQLTTSSRVPTINSPNEVLVKVHAASINPIDLAMTKGYGAETINIIRDLGLSKADSPLELRHMRYMV